MEVKEKKVELIELFYDLIYVFAISKVTKIIEEPEDGVISLDDFALYLLSALVVLQAWTYMTNYVNRYGSWRWYEYVLCAVNMVGALYMSISLTSDADAEVRRVFLSSMIVVLSTVALLYIIQIRKSYLEPSAARNSVFILAIVIATFALAQWVSYIGFPRESVYITAAAILEGAFLPLIIRGTFSADIVSFPHLVERFELLTIITFGESIVGMTEFFEPGHDTLVAVTVFVTVVLMFGSYVTEVHYICDHHRVSRGLTLVYAHYALIIAVNLIDVAYLFFLDAEADHGFTAALLIASMLLFYLSLYAMSVYNRPEYRFAWQHIAESLCMLAVGSAVILAFMGSAYGFLVGALIMSAGDFLLLWTRYHRARCRLEKPPGTECRALDFREER